MHSLSTDAVKVNFLQSNAFKVVSKGVHVLLVPSNSDPVNTVLVVRVTWDSGLTHHTVYQRVFPVCYLNLSVQHISAVTGGLRRLSSRQTSAGPRTAGPIPAARWDSFPRSAENRIVLQTPVPERHSAARLSHRERT